MTSTNKRRVLMLLLGACALALSTMSPSGAQSDSSSGQDAATVALAHLVQERSALGLTATDIAGLEVTDVVPLSNPNVHAVYVQQRVGGIDVVGATLVIVVDRGEVIAVEGQTVAGAEKLISSLVPGATAIQAAAAGAEALGLQPVRPFASQQLEPGPRQRATLSNGGVADADIPARLVLQALDGGELALAWELTFDTSDSDEVWQVRIDANSGAELDRTNLVSADTYNVFEQPTEAPSFGTRTTVVDPADATASPFGWFDVDGVPGAEFTTTEGNNVTAYADTDFDQQPDPGRPDGGAALSFDYQLDLSKEPIDSQEAAITNLFYWTNILHDITYRFGFDEASGNFQTNNYGRGGLGGDAVRAEAQDGFTTNNATFFTPVDGSPPRLQMYLFTDTTPNRDSSLDAGLIAHEYGHGMTDRLTGGPASVTCLDNQEQPSEGWSDFFSLMMTMQPGDTGTSPRGFATWVLGQPTTGPGLRDAPYTTNMAIDPRTYATIITANEPHGVGSVFAAMLWEMAWALIAQDGFTADLLEGTGGNVTAMQLVTDGLKLQPCSPGFVDARDAILLADQLNNDSADACLIWGAFAKRGLGFSATQGDPDDKTDGTEAFDLPPNCTDLVLSVAASPSPVMPDETLTKSFDVTNNAPTDLTNVTITSPVPAGTTYVGGSVTCAGNESAGVVTMLPGTLNASATEQCSFGVRTNPGPGTVTWLNDDFESGFPAWSVSNGAGSLNWATTTAQAMSGVTSAFATNLGEVSDQYLTLTAPVPVSSASELRFAHLFSTENTWDGGVVEISTDGSTWTDLGPLMSVNGYGAMLNSSANPLSGRLAFTGDSGGWLQTVIDLSSYAGSSVQIRFRFGSDASVGEDGWYIDDVEIVDPVTVLSVASATSAEGASAQASLTTDVFGSSAPGQLRVTTNPAVPSVLTVDGLWTDAFGLDWVDLAPGGYQVCYSGVPGFSTPDCETAVLSAGATTSIQGEFVTRATLDIVTTPPVAATITIDGSPVNDWGAIVSIESGNYDVCFGLVEGWDPPPCETVVATAGATMMVTGAFVQNAGASGPVGVGTLRATTSPAVPSQLSIDGVGAQSFGLDWVKLPPGSREICFGDVPGFTSPPCETVAIVDGVTTVISGTFIPLAELRVLTSPPANQPITVDARVIDQYGFWTWAPAATYDICAQGYECQTVAAPSSTLTTVTLVPTS